MHKKTIHELHEMKRRGEPITWLTAYDYPTATFEAAAGIDMILVGDSLGMCVYGYSGTVPVTMDQCIVHCQAVRRGAPQTVVIGDMPFMSYQVSDEEEVANAGRFLKEVDVDGQLLIVSDVLGTCQAFTPKFVKKYADIAGVSVAALTEYVGDVRTGRFPGEEHCYRMLDGEAERFAEWTRAEA